uniref:Uncharacterized protein n=1 Tax=Cajanus cajan TaxID=3821 RepID=A0A151SY74_CAJCA|nr:hypothetical protein KK1_015108 [Cajanus cajan]
MLCIYKILSKVITNYQKPFLAKCIALKQYAFVENRFILDNALLAFETIHHMKCKTKGRKRKVALKLDVGKACDKIEWGYLKSILLKMRFFIQWLKWM